jgi:hypothetical protein
MLDVSIHVAGIAILRHAPHTIKSLIGLGACDIDAWLKQLFEMAKIGDLGRVLINRGRQLARRWISRDAPDSGAKTDIAGLPRCAGNGQMHRIFLHRVSV